jgi:hypothetical protein
MINSIPYTTPAEEQWLSNLKSKKRQNSNIKPLKSKKIFTVDRNPSWFGKLVDGKLR